MTHTSSPSNPQYPPLATLPWMPASHHPQLMRSRLSGNWLTWVQRSRSLPPNLHHHKQEGETLSLSWPS